MNRAFIRRNINSFAIILFIILFAVIQLIKPAFLYTPRGCIRDFGIGYKNKTVIPMWFVAIILSILSYLFVLHYIVYPKMK
jgi:hypothetical protein